MHPDPDVARRGRAGRAALLAAPTRTARSPTSPACATPTGIVLGLMPHPENHVVARQHPHHLRGGRARAPRACAVPQRRRRYAKDDVIAMRTSLFDPFIEIDLPLARSARRQGARVVRAAATGSGCSSPPTACRRSTGSSPACPYKGQVLNQLSAWWFERTADIVANHVVAVPDPNVLDRPRRHAAAGRGRRARLHHRRHSRRCGAVRRRRPHDLRLRLPRRAAQEHAAPRADRHARRPRPSTAATTSR